MGHWSNVMKTSNSDSRIGGDSGTSCMDAMQLELDFAVEPRESAVVIQFPIFRVRSRDLHEDASRRLLQFAETLPDW
jgi:hypothetical protein